MKRKRIYHDVVDKCLSEHQQSQFCHEEKLDLLMGLVAGWLGLKHLLSFLCIYDEGIMAIPMYYIRYFCVVRCLLRRS